MFQAVLTYDVLTGYQNNIQMRNKISGITSMNVTDTAAALGFDRVGDQTVSTSALTVRRQITLRTNSVGDRLWNSEEQVAAILTRLFRGALAVLTPSIVTASDPVVTTV
jgi:hypothetical protein